MPDLPARDYTVLFSDIEGSTRLWEQQPELMQGVLARHDALLRHAVETHAGRFVKTTGDGVHAVFPSAGDAVAAAVAGQRTLAGEPCPPTATVRVRMGIHTGLAQPRAGDFFGTTLNRAARLMSAGHGGQILISRAALEAVGSRLPPGVSLRDLGERRLKDLAAPIQVLQVVVTDLPAEFPPLNTLDARPNNLPVQPTPLVGREAETAEALGRLRTGARLLTFTGPGGTGKTRLALHVAAELADEFAAGVFFVALAPIRAPDLVAPTIAGTLGLSEVGQQPILDTLGAYLRDRQLLLVLDNFEQVAEAAPVVAALLASAPRLQVIATSRAALHLQAEQEFRVEPLALPDPARPPDPAELERIAAPALFVQRAAAVRREFAVTPENAATIAAICARLDGLPLAIELAAARSRLLSPAALLARLERRLTLLTGGPRDLPARHQTLRDAIAWSYELLGANEQRLFRYLAAFTGGCTIEAAETVCDLPAAEPPCAGSVEAEAGTARRAPAQADTPWFVLDGLDTLVDQSLLRRDEAPNGEPRVSMLETIREFGLEQLAASGELAASRRAHADYFVRLAEGLGVASLGRQIDPAAVASLEREHDNLRAALAWSADSGATELGLRGAVALWGFWSLRGHISEGRHWLDTLLDGPGEVPAALRGRALHAAGALARRQGDYAAAAARHEASLALFRALGDRHGTASALGNLGLVFERLGAADRAAACHREAEQIFRQLGLTANVAAALNNLGNIALAEGDHERAAALFEEARALRQAAGDRWGVALAQLNLGRVREYQADLTRAAALYTVSLQTFRELGHTLNIARALTNLGDVALMRGEPAEAAPLYAESLDRRRELEDALGVAEALTNLGHVALALDEPDRALAHYAASLPRLQELGDQALTAECLDGVAAVAADRGDDHRAAQLFGAAESLRAAVRAVKLPVQRTLHARCLATVRGRLGPAVAGEVLAQGRAMSLAEVVACASAFAADVAAACPFEQPLGGSGDA